MFFDADGSVWFNPAMRPGRDELFAIAASRLLYAASNPPGRRYRVADARPPAGDAGAEWPVGDVSWFGAMKYCNWLTLDAGFDLSARRYREGTNALDWAPATCAPTNWIRGVFTAEDRRRWDAIKGMALPLAAGRPRDGADAARGVLPGTSSWANAFNEFYKGAAWNGTSNAKYGFGDDTFNARDANYLDSGAFAWHDTTPVGFYDGSTHAGVFQTSANRNHYGIHDLSGNVAEWLTDPGLAGAILDRASYGGSWLFTLPTVQERQYVHPHFTDRFRGFRVVTTAMPRDMFMVRIPYRICLCGYGVGAGCARPERRDVAGDAPEGRAGNTLTVERAAEEPGILYRPTAPAQPPRPSPGRVIIPPESPSGL